MLSPLAPPFSCCRANDDAELRFRMQELEALEAAFVGLEGPQGDELPPPPPAPPADWQRFRNMADPLVPSNR